MADYREILRLQDLGDSQHTLKVQSSRNAMLAVIVAAQAARVS